MAGCKYCTGVNVSAEFSVINSSICLNMRYTWCTEIVGYGQCYNNDVPLFSDHVVHIVSP